MLFENVKVGDEVFIHYDHLREKRGKVVKVTAAMMEVQGIYLVPHTVYRRNGKVQNSKAVCYPLTNELNIKLRGYELREEIGATISKIEAKCRDTRRMNNQQLENLKVCLDSAIEVLNDAR